jgi:integrase
MEADMGGQQAFKFTDRFLKTCSAEGARVQYRDTGQTGLHLRVSPSGKRTFLVKSRGSDGRVHSITLGAYPEINLRDARKQAQAAIADIKGGENINAVKRARRSAHETCPNLRALLEEYEGHARASRKIWQPGNSGDGKSNARARIECTFERLLDKPVSDITPEDLAAAMQRYKPKRPQNGKATANGGIARSRSYLKPVLDWAAGRGRFAKIGAGRLPSIEAPDIGLTFDPSLNDPTVGNVRRRVLSQDELIRLLPLLTYPAPPQLSRNMPIERDVRPAAFRFILLTLARVDEVASMRWRNILWDTKVWYKPEVKNTSGGAREQNLPLSNAAITLLKSLPGYQTGHPDDLVFQNAQGGPLGNWFRFTSNIQKCAGLEHFHRHDLRRTSATLLRALRVAPATVETVLGHTHPLRMENVSDSAKHYMIATEILEDASDPVRDALELLATTLIRIESG